MENERTPRRKGGGGGVKIATEPSECKGTCSDLSPDIVERLCADTSLELHHKVPCDGGERARPRAWVSWAGWRIDARTHA